MLNIQDYFQVLQDLFALVMFINSIDFIIYLISVDQFLMAIIF